MKNDAHILEADKSDMRILSDIIVNSYKTVAQKFDLTPENCPKHPSNCTVEWIQNDIKRGVIYYKLLHQEKVTGCVALEKASSETCYLERLAVLPE